MQPPLPLPVLDPADLRIVPIARAETIPSAWYTAPAFHDWDLQTVFADAWHYVGHRSQFPAAGRYVASPAAGQELVVVRDDEGVIRAFHNVCRHRGGPLTMDACGSATMLQCKYHGWTYRLDGSLRGVPRFNRVDLFDKRDYGLVPVRLEEWEGLLFAHLGEPGISLHAVMAGIAERIAPLRLSDLQFARRVTYDLRCNWKTYVDNYLEGYHLPYVHPDLCDVLDVAAYTTELSPHHVLQHSPLGDTPNLYGTAADAAYYYFVFPGVMLNILPGRLQMNSVVPLAADRCLVVFDYLYADAEAPEMRQRIEDDVAFSDRVQQEDIAICERVQRGLASPAYDRGRFSVECEQGVYHFQSMLKHAYRGAARLQEAGP